MTHSVAVASPDLRGRRALVCGASQGIGRACAQELARLGASVTIVARRVAELRRAAAELPRRAGQKHEWFSADFSDPEALGRAVANRLKSSHPIHILVNNSGGPPPSPILEATPDQFLAAFRQHVLCNHLISRALIPGMKAAGYGRIVNIISTSVRRPIRNLGVSNTTRAAVANWARTLAGEVGPLGITVNNILPGLTATERLKSLLQTKAAQQGRPVADLEAALKAEIPVGRFAEPREIAAAVGFLAGPGASFINGIDLTIDGGRLAITAL